MFEEVQESFECRRAPLYRDHRLDHQHRTAIAGASRIPELPYGWVGGGGGGCGRSDGGVLIMSWKLSSVAGSFAI